MARGRKRALDSHQTSSPAPPTPASTRGPLPPPSTSQPTPQAPLTTQDPPMTLASMEGHMVLPSPLSRLHHWHHRGRRTHRLPQSRYSSLLEQLPTSQLSSKSSSTGLTTLGLRSHSRFEICGGESFRNDQKDLTKRFSQSKYLEEFHKHQMGGEEGGKKFHEVRRKAEEDAEASGIPTPDDLQLIAIIASGVSCDHLCGASSEAAHFIAENSRAAAGLASFCLDHE
ncbi:hypothetical protein M9H77_20786 [Catharanthus roseus]|uniref:Uncharacterized protein n=1 Tax=Catharanthus roseus TaxID=4058 RepID=A0ACC0APV6_CATRO|nr:hypothetical protein M9H77_20786 [Catharanthus roseus]